MDDYVAFMKKYTSDPNNALSMMGDYMENWRQTCMRHVPRISKGTYYTTRSSILFYAHQYAYNIGLISPFGKLY